MVNSYSCVTAEPQYDTGFQWCTTNSFFPVSAKEVGLYNLTALSYQLPNNELIVIVHEQHFLNRA